MITYIEYLQGNRFYSSAHSLKTQLLVWLIVYNEDFGVYEIGVFVVGNTFRFLILIIPLMNYSFSVQVMLAFKKNFWKDKLGPADFFGRIPDTEEDRGFACLFYDVSTKVFLLVSPFECIGCLSLNMPNIFIDWGFLLLNWIPYLLIIVPYVAIHSFMPILSFLIGNFDLITTSLNY